MKHDVLLSLNLPYRNLFFTDRKDALKLIHERLSAGNARPQALCGLGGIGKTQVAIEYAYRYGMSYRAVLWVHAETLNSDMATIAEQLGLPERSEQDQNLAIAAVKRWLRDQTHWLLILDNVEDEKILDDFILPSNNGHLLLTTQATTIEDQAQIIVLDKLNDREGAILLLHRAGITLPNTTFDQSSPVERDKAEEISHLMGGLPLALDQAGAYIEETECGLSGYLERYQKQHRLLLDRRGGLLPDHPESVVTTLSLSSEKAERVHPLAGDILRLCAFLYHDAIPEEILTEGASAFNHAHPSNITPPQEAADAIDVLCKFSLLRCDPASRMLSIHRLMQTVLQDDMDEARQRVWAECAVMAVSQTFPAIDFTTWPLCERYRSQARACVKLIKQWNIETIEAAHLLHETAFYLYERADYTYVEELYQQALSIRKKVLGPKHPYVADDLHHLALFYRRQGKFAEAEDLFRQALQIRELTLTPGSPYTAASFHELGRIHSDQGKYIEAEEPFKQALKMREQALPAEHSDIAASLNELGWLYRHLGRYEDAEVLLSRALVMRENTLEPGDPRIAQTLNDLSWVYYDKGKYELVESLLLRALAIREQALGPEHPDTAQTLNTLALLYCVQSKYAESEVLYQRALAIRERALGSGHPDVAQTLDNLALLYYHQERYAEAEPLYQRALTIRRKALRTEHPNITQTLNNLARLHLAQGRYDQAEGLLKESLRLREQALGQKHPHVANCLHNLAILYVAQQKYTDAEELYQRALTIREQALGHEHTQVAQTLNDIATLYGVRGKYEQARQLYQEALGIYGKTPLSTHPYVATILTNYAELLRKMGRESEATEMEARARIIKKQK